MMPNLLASLKTKPKRFRAPIARGLAAAGGEPHVDPKGGDFGAGIIRGCAIITVGEALGHYLWIDQEFLNQVATAINATGEKGSKQRFTHPGLSSDGLGKLIGRAKNATIDGDIVRADLHLQPSSRNTPHGDLGGYVMELAEEDPEAFGNSIVFDHDFDTEEQFEAEHTVDGEFVSPDPKNENGYCHCRLSKLWGVDVVDEPAANPGGFFHRGSEIPQAADELLSYCLGLTSERPGNSLFDVDPDRLRPYLQRYLDRYGLSITSKEGTIMPLKNPLTSGGKKKLAADKKPAEKKPAEGAKSEGAAGGEGETQAEGGTDVEGDEIEEDPEDETPGEKKPVPTEGEVEGEGEGEGEKKDSAMSKKVAQFRKAFGKELGSIYFADGLSFAQATVAFGKVQQKRNEELESKVGELEGQVNALKGEKTPVEFDGGGEGTAATNKFRGRLGSKLSKFAAGIESKLNPKK